MRFIEKDSLRLSQGAVLQDTHLFTGTVMDNNLLQNPLALHVGEVHLVQAHRSPQLGAAEVLAGDVAHRPPDERHRRAGH